MVISADCVAGLGIGASTVSVPSGDREEETRVGSTPGGNLDMQRERERERERGRRESYTPLCTSCSLCPPLWVPPLPSPQARRQNSRVFAGEAPRDVAMLVLSLFMLAWGRGERGGKERRMSESAGWWGHSSQPCTSQQAPPPAQSQTDGEVSMRA
jgi:hypothetical protein